jgi:transposase-like protein
MAEKRTRRRFTAEFKAEAVKRLLEGGKGLSEVATELGLSPGQLSAWRNEHLAAGSAEALPCRKVEQAEAAAAQAREQAAGGGGRDPQEGRGFFRPGDRVSRCRFAFVAAERANHAVARLCRMVGASVSGFYAWLRAIPATRARAEAEAELRGHVGRIFSPADGSTARRASAPSCAGRAGATRAGAWRG